MASEWEKTGRHGLISPDIRMATAYYLGNYKGTAVGSAERGPYHPVERVQH